MSQPVSTALWQSRVHSSMELRSQRAVWSKWGKLVWQPKPRYMFCQNYSSYVYIIPQNSDRSKLSLSWPAEQNLRNLKWKYSPGQKGIWTFRGSLRRQNKRAYLNFDFNTSCSNVFDFPNSPMSFRLVVLSPMICCWLSIEHTTLSWWVTMMRPQYKLAIVMLIWPVTLNLLQFL